MLDSKYAVYLLCMLVLLSKNFIIVNEETLVLISFICFVFCCHRYGSDTVSEMLSARRDEIQSESLQLNRMTQSVLEALISNYESQAAFCSTHHEFTDKMNVSSSNTMKSIGGGYSSHFFTLISTQFRQKIETLERAEKEVQEKCRQTVSSCFRSIVLDGLQKAHKAGHPTHSVAAVKKALSAE